MSDGHDNDESNYVDEFILMLYGDDDDDDVLRFAVHLLCHTFAKLVLDDGDGFSWVANNLLPFNSLRLSPKGTSSLLSRT